MAKKYLKDVVDKIAEELLVYAASEPIPFLSKFCAERRIAQPMLTQNPNFSENEKFVEAHQVAKMWLEYKLCMIGLSGKANPAMAIFALKNCSGWRDKIEDITREDNLAKEELEIFKRNGDRVQQYQQFLGVTKN